MTLVQDRLQNGFKLLEHFAVGEANNAIAFFIQPLSARLIIFNLIGFGMGVAIDLNAQFSIGAIEIDDEMTDGLLPPDFETAQLPITHTRPQFDLGWCLRLTQFARRGQNRRIDAMLLFS